MNYEKSELMCACRKAMLHTYIFIHVYMYICAVYKIWKFVRDLHVCEGFLSCTKLLDICMEIS